jgi:Tfp pilus assembly protein PilV
MKRLFDFRFSIGDRGFRRSPRFTRHSPHAIPPAFSLVEVVMALGIVSVALLAVIGMLPVGLRSVKNANELAGASLVMNRLADAVREADSANGVDFTNSVAGTNIAYRIGGPAVTNPFAGLSLEGATNGGRLNAVLVITPPASATTPGRAFVSVGWPSAAEWQSGSTNWKNAEGSVTTALQFLPRP